MKILFECKDGSHVVELHKKRLYAKVASNSKTPVVYSNNFSVLLNPGTFQEYKGEDAMLAKHVEKIIADDLKKAM